MLQIYFIFCYLDLRLILMIYLWYASNIIIFVFFDSQRKVLVSWKILNPIRTRNPNFWIAYLQNRSNPEPGIEPQPFMVNSQASMVTNTPIQTTKLPYNYKNFQTVCYADISAIGCFVLFLMGNAVLLDCMGWWVGNFQIFYISISRYLYLNLE